MSEIHQWLTLKQAAQKLGVHPATLRRWADNDEISFMRTPGGHRRFALADIEQFAKEHRQLRIAADLGQVWATQALTHTRREITSSPEMPWLIHLDDQARAQSRLTGQRLMGLLMQYLSRNDQAEDILQEAQTIGQQYASTAQQIDMPMTNALQATQFFRDTLIESAIQLPHAANITPEANLRLMRRVNTLINAIQLAIVEAYQ